MDEQRLAEIERVTAAATPGEWEWAAIDATAITLYSKSDPYAEMNGFLTCERCEACAERDAKCGFPSKEDAAFIALARSAVPELCAALREAWAKLATPPDIDKIAANLNEMRLLKENSELRSEVARLRAITEKLPRLLRRWAMSDKTEQMVIIEDYIEREITTALTPPAEQP